MQRRAISSDKPRSIAAPASTAVELAQLRIRVIALENLAIALLAQVSDRQLDLARQMAAYISPRPGFTHHRPTIHAEHRWSIWLSAPSTFVFTQRPAAKGSDMVRRPTDAAVRTAWHRSEARLLALAG